MKTWLLFSLTVLLAGCAARKEVVSKCLTGRGYKVLN